MEIAWKKTAISCWNPSNKGTISLVLGSTGNKGESRRKDFGLLLEDHPEIQVFLTADDPNYEDPLAIAEEISSFITRPVEKIADREQAIQLAMATTSKPEDAVIIAGKGADCYQIVNGVKRRISRWCRHRWTLSIIKRKSNETRLGSFPSLYFYKNESFFIKFDS